MDANFRLKQKARGIKDPELGSGLAYFVDTNKFRNHLKDTVYEGKVSRYIQPVLDDAYDHDRLRHVGQSSTR